MKNDKFDTDCEDSNTKNLNRMTIHLLLMFNA